MHVYNKRHVQQLREHETVRLQANQRPMNVDFVALTTAATLPSSIVTPTSAIRSHSATTISCPRRRNSKSTLCSFYPLFKHYYPCRASQCEGQYCYITLTTAEMALDYDQNVDYVYDFLDENDGYDDYGQHGLTGADYEASYGRKRVDRFPRLLTIHCSFG